ncbi:erg13, 3-hydroxy-3-methylglutaryl-CoA (HMG-CoA) synthase [Talaromyces proteolyticus]|uniref:Hydroxymethylglutaryl-CoA synthase n=1 Tax=Talaromyces proteolyticus TaxID=1131652 RepID=A0AAD4PV17_9EURO|nr:erg13, 3-hydroxy-3-methylglutaryl-CoA (HMG-CoA) synthase [Talaromyces proteolyticus]KAH8695990.1 erg13, 3-hydroxy-3-methylglutaryl-CoA (HMG-CoA) synthase [Talaromyces proteolyticus]
MSGRPQNVGIKALEIYFPNQYVDQTDLEKYMGVSAGKFTLGLGQATMAFCDDREDIYSILLTTVSSLLKRYSISATSIGRLEVGTETILDKAKSCKSVLMQLFSPSGNNDIEGIDTIHACYGGTNALFNAVNWIESSSWDGRDAIVAMGDIALYDTPAARPTGGVGCVAMLIGPDAPLVVEGSSKTSWMQHAYDFYKPDFGREYPVVDGHYSNTCYLTALEECYRGYQAKKEKSTTGEQPLSNRLDAFDYMIFHAPYCKLVAKSYARLLYQDYLHNPSSAVFSDVPAGIKEIDHETSLTDKTIEKTFVALSKANFATRVQPSLTAATLCGNSYTASVYSCLISLICNIPSPRLQGATVGVFSYGGGSASTLYTIRVRGDVDVGGIAEKIDLHRRLEGRLRVSAEEYNQACTLREQAHQQKSFIPKGSIDRLSSGTYYLTEIDEAFRRKYAVKESN